jgi:hypothetical protein
MKKLIIITLLYSLNLFSQHKLEGNAGLSYPVYTNDYDGQLYNYWKLGLNVGLNGNIKLIEEMHLVPSIRYHYFFFNKYEQSIRFYDIAINSSGNGSHVLKLGVDVNILDNDNIILLPFIILGGGYTIEKYGTMKITWRNPDGDIHTTVDKYPDRDYWYYVYGLGLRYNISSNFVIRTSLKSYANKSQFTDSRNESYWILDCNIFYTIIK